MNCHLTSPKYILFPNNPSPYLWVWIALCFVPLSSCYGCSQEESPFEVDAPKDLHRRGIGSKKQADYNAKLFARHTSARAQRFTSMQQGRLFAKDLRHGAQVTINRLFDHLMEPQIVSYRIANGGTMQDIANRYKLFPSEVMALNPGMSLTESLEPGTRVAVYRQNPEKQSQSIGLPSRGSLKNPVPMMDGPGRIIRAKRWKSWGTSSTIAHLDYVLRQWAKLQPNAHRVLVGNLSSRKGGHLNPHVSHQSGRDVDLSYPQKWDGKSKVNWRKMTKANLDAEKAWVLIKLLVKTGTVEVIFIDYEIQRLLYDHALSHGSVPTNSLNQWLQYPNGRRASPRLIEHVAGHDDHIHVRFHCRTSEPRCKTQRRKVNISAAMMKKSSTSKLP